MRNRMTFWAGIAIALTLAACFIVPGKFASNIDVGRNGAFTFAYKGELMFATSPALVRQSQAEGDEKFAAECVDEDNFEERACSEEEIAEQKAEWEAVRAEKAANVAQFSAMFGGINPGDPATMDAFAARLSKEQGWKSVVHKGDGVFEVDYALTGRLDRDFVWPIFPGVEIIKPIIAIHRRADGSVEVGGPGLATADDQSARALGGIDADAPGDNANARTEGRLTLTTDADILTNNTDDGPARAGARQQLVWDVTSGTKVAPKALLKLD